MTAQSKKLAQDAIYSVAPATRKFILDMAMERARSQHSASMALDARITQACYIQFAAAAVAAALAGAAGNASCGAVCVFATIAFIAGSALCFRGVRSDAHHAPGLPPDWWGDAVDYPSFPLAHAQCWAAGAIQEMMEDVETENVHRANSLNLSLRFALAGAVLIGVAGIIKVVGIR